MNALGHIVVGSLVKFFSGLPDEEIEDKSKQHDTRNNNIDADALCGHVPAVSGGLNKASGDLFSHSINI